MPLNGVITSNGKVWCERSLLHILKRGSAPLGGGEVHLLCSFDSTTIDYSRVGHSQVLCH